MTKSLFNSVSRFRLGVLAFALVVLFGAGASSEGVRAQGRIGDLGRLGGQMVSLKLGEITLEQIDFRNQTATLSLGLDVKNGLVPVSLKDFDYDLRLAGQQFVSGRHDGTLKVGGRRQSRVNLPVTVHLRSIPGVLWSAFSNRGNLRYELDTAFTLPLFITERRFDQSLDGEVPLRSIVDAASIARARGMGVTGIGGGILDRIGGGSRGNRNSGGWPF